MSFKPEVKVAGESTWSRNGLVFATEAEAMANAGDLAMRWTMVQDFRAVPSDEPVNYTYINGKLEQAKESVT